MREKTVECLAPPDFEELSKSTLLSIVKDEAMNISELNLFDAVVRWTRFHCAQRALENNGTNMRQVYKLVTFIITKLSFH